MELDRALEHALDGRALLFTGAGFSRGAINLRKGPFKTAGQFANYLAKEVGLPAGTPLDDASEEFVTRFGEDRLVSEIQMEFTAKQISKGHELLASVPWRKIYTTNYDDVLERGYGKAGRPLTSITMSDDIRAIPKNHTLCVHLNGYVGRLTRATIWTEAKVTDTSYLTATLAESPWATVFREDVEIARAVFFVGYSLSDLDIRRILYQGTTLPEKCFFVVGDQPAPNTISRAKRFGTILQYGSENFAVQMTDKSRSYSPPELAGPIPHCLRRFEVSSSSPRLSDRSIFDLLLLGQVNPQFVWKSLHGGQRYSLHRHVAQMAMDYVEAGVRAVVIHSELGNGKSLILEEIKCQALDKDYAVYSLVRPGESLHEELEWALQDPQKSLFIVDNYADWLDVLKFYASHSNSGSVVVLAARSSTHDVLADRLSEILRVPNMREIPVDELGSDELAWIADYFDEYGLWGDKTAWLRERKIEYLSRVCRAQWHAILLRLFESPQILRKFNEIFDDLKTRRNYYEVLITLLVLSVLVEVPSVEMLVDMLGPRVLETGFKRDPAIREVVDFKLDEVKFRSSAAGEFILKRIADPNATVEVLISLARSAHKLKDVSVYYHQMLTALARFGNLQHLLPETGRAKAIFHYYETIKVFNFYQTDPLFWLQYAIAGLVFEEFDRAEKYFDAAYSFAQRRGAYDSYQIDNHYARFLLVRAMHSSDASRCMIDFRRARTLILTQMQRERLHYSYRVATTLWPFYGLFSRSLSEKEKNEIKDAARTIADRIDKLPDALQRNRSVNECSIAMQKILQS